MHLASVQPLYRATGGSEFAQISIHGPIRRCMKRTSLQARPGRCAYCTNARFTFSCSPSPLHPFHLHLASVQPLYRAKCGHLLYRLRVFIFQLPFPLVSCSSTSCISATSAPCRKIHSNFRKFALTALYGAVREGWVCS